MTDSRRNEILQAAQIALNLEKWHEADELAVGCLRKKLDDYEALKIRATVHSRLGNHKRAAIFFGQAGLCGSCSESYIAAVRAYLKDSDCPGAAWALQQALSQLDQDGDEDKATQVRDEFSDIPLD